ncbi:MAG: cbb3-type cytochrome oxidase assembly protein CcoS [Qingshengfaniella sp.]
MSLLTLIPLSIGLGLIGLWAFFWALRNGQFEDPEGAAWRVIPPESRTDAAETQDSSPARKT